MRTHFFVKLTPRRPRFGVDMTPEEKTLMEAHAAYWEEMMKDGHVHVFGPVMDESGLYGMGIVSAESAAGVEEMLEEGSSATSNDDDHLSDDCDLTFVKP